MRRKLDWRHGLAALLVAAVVAVVLGAFSLMSRTDRRELSLADSPEARFGWSYELLADGAAQAYEPAFAEGSYNPVLPEGTRAVRIARTMTEDIPRAELEWHTYLDGVEVYLDGALLYSDFQREAPRDADGFLRLDDADWEQLHEAQGDTWRRVRMSLPEDYLGKELCVTTYFPEEWGTPVPEYPVLGSEDSYIAGFIVFSVKYDVVMTIYALVAVLVAALFLLDMSNDGADARTLLLCLYFLLLFLTEASSSYAGYYSELNASADMNFLYGVYVAPLYLYLALQLKSRWKYPLCGAVLIWAVYEGVREYLSMRGGSAGSIGPEALAVMLVVAAAYCAGLIERERRNRFDRRRATTYAVLTAAVVFVQVFSRVRAWGSARDYLVDGVGTALQMGNFEPIVNLATDIVSTVALIVMVLEFVRRTLRTRQEMSVLQDRARQTMEGYERLLAAESATNALHHEMRHHMTALSGILKSGDLERAERYADAVAGDLDQLPTGRYSQNLLVDVIAGSFLDRAWAMGIQVEHRLAVPPEMDIADEDLSVFLSNMLQNALEACERLGEGAERHIKVEMRLHGKFLFLHCVNSAAEAGAEGERRSGHGYGLAAMRRIAEKYNSTLVIERGNGEFSIKSDLCLRGD